LVKEAQHGGAGGRGENAAGVARLAAELGPAFTMVKASIEMAQTAVSHPQNSNALWEEYNKLIRAINRLEKGIDYS
jgi:hypothetical protein